MNSFINKLGVALLVLILLGTFVSLATLAINSERVFSYLEIPEEVEVKETYLPYFVTILLILIAFLILHILALWDKIDKFKQIYSP